jgi:penicillin-binding protein 1C
MTGWRKMLPRLAGAVLLAGSAAVGGALLWLHELGPLPFDRTSDVSRLVVDREGRLLRPFTTAEGVWRLPVDVADVDQRFLTMLKAYEDKRFERHPGIDPLAMLRAGGQMLAAGRIVSGGSTLTMQVARLLEPREGRSLTAKLRQTLRAIELERRLSKREILRLYLTLAPYGGNIEGVRAASLGYFGKEPRRLSLGEAALLVALPQAPEARRPDRDAAMARVARDRVLERLQAAGIIPAEDVERAKAEPVPTARRPVPMLAAHLTDRLAHADATSRILRTTLDQRLQIALEALIRERVSALGPRLSAALLVIDNASGEIRAHVASAGYLDAARQGAVDMTMALRSPGSALKPFVYALAFEQGLAHPETLIEDRPLRYGAYAPENFDLGHQGTITMRRALQQSLNVPVVELLTDVRPAQFLGRLGAAGASIVVPRETAPGLAVGLGGVGVTLTDLAMLYAGLARGGDAIALTATPRTEVPSHRRLVDAVAAWYVADILRGAPPPDGATTGRFAFKTGTSYGYRDAWAVGFDRNWTIAVWVGRPDNAPVAGLVGRLAAAPILFDAVARLNRAPDPPPRPSGALIATTAALPPPLRAFGSAAAVGALGTGVAEAPLRVAFPPDGARVERDMGEGVILRASGGVPPLLWLVDGRPIGSSGHRRSLDWSPPGPGFARVTVTDARGASASVSIRLD